MTELDEREVSGGSNDLTFAGREVAVSVLLSVIREVPPVPRSGAETAV
jgi:hypothetical protein